MNGERWPGRKGDRSTHTTSPPNQQPAQSPYLSVAGEFGGCRFVMDLCARQPRRQLHAPGALGGGWQCLGSERALQGQHFFFDGSHIRIHRLVEQARLRRIELFTAPAVTPALVERQLLRELIDVGLCLKRSA